MQIIGIDVGKSHTAACLTAASPVTIKKIPVLSFPNSASGFQQMVAWLATFPSPSGSPPAVLLERTGHYHLALQHFLLERGFSVYELAPQHRLPGETKSDQQDARKLAVLLHNHLAANVIELDQRQMIRRVEPAEASESLAHLGELTRRRDDLTAQMTQRKNQLRAVLDRVFPEFVRVFLDPSKKTALALLERFPSRAEIASASLDELAAIARLRPGRAKLAELQELAACSIGQDSPALRLELRQLVRELRLLDSHLGELEQEIARMVGASRAGQILLSIPGMGEQHAAILLAGIGDIRRFPTKAALKAFCGWAPGTRQSGSTLNSSSLMRGGNRLLRKTLYLVAWNAIQRETPWRALYERLVPLKCEYDPRSGTYKGKNKVIGRVCGCIVEMIWTLLHKDIEREAAGLPPAIYEEARHAKTPSRGD